MLEEPDDNLENENEGEADAAIDETLIAALPKKPISKFQIGGFGAIVAGLLVMCVMHMRHGPAPAAAASVAPSAQTNQTISQFLSGGASDIRNIKTSLETTQKEVRNFENYPSVQQVPLGNLKTNPFAYRSDDHSDEEIQRKKAAEEAAMQKAAADLKLQSVMYSSRSNARSACMINNSLCSLGAQIEGFSVIKINPNSVVLAQGSFQVELKLEK